MDVLSKSVTQLDEADLIQHPIWEYTNTEAIDELQVRPVLELPVNTLANRVVGTRVRLHNGSERWAVLSNVSLRDARRTSHFLCLSIAEYGQWLHLARYFDADYERAGPVQFAALLGLPVDEVFPIAYDLSAVVVGADMVARGEVPREPSEKLTDEELTKMSLEKERA